MNYKYNSRIEWLDCARGFLILFLIFSHSWKIFLTTIISGLQIREILPHYFHFFTQGFAGIAGITIVILWDKISNKKNLNPQQYCRIRAFRLIGLALFISLIISSHWTYTIPSPKSNNWQYWHPSHTILDILTFGKSLGFQRFICLIAIFLMVAPYLVKLTSRNLIVLLLGVTSIIPIIKHFLPPQGYLFPHWIFLNNFQGALFYFSVGGIGISLGRFIQSPYGKFFQNPGYSLVVFLTSIACVSAIENNYDIHHYTRFLFTPNHQLDLLSIIKWDAIFLIDWSLRLISLVAVGHLIASQWCFRWIQMIFINLGTFALMSYLLHIPIGLLFKHLLRYKKYFYNPDYLSVQEFYLFYFALYSCAALLLMIFMISWRKSRPKLNQALHDNLAI